MPQPQGNGARPRNRLDAVRAALEEVEQQENEEGVHVHVHMPAATRDGATVEDEPTQDEDGVEARISSIEDGMLEMRAMLQEALARPRTTDSVTIPPAGDSAALDKSFQQMIARAEILVPGFRAPTFDSALSRAKTVDSMCATRRQVLTTLAATTDGAALINAVADDGFDVAAADCAAVAVAFNAAASVKAANNTRAATGDRLTVPQAGAGVVVVPSGGVKQISDAELNKLHQEYWSKN